MKYRKPALTFEQQAGRLIDRGLIAPDKPHLIHCLQSVNYYRLSAYWFHFRRINPATGEERFAPGTNFETIWRRYNFDHKLRMHIMDSIEHVEVCLLRTRLVEQFTLRHGPFGYCDKGSFRPNVSVADHAKWMEDVEKNVLRSREEFIDWFRKKYTLEPHLPLWMAVEVMSFGQLFTLYTYLHRVEQRTLADAFRLYPPVLESWLKTLNYVRNACAHHARLWNREMPIRPIVPEKRNLPEWHSPIVFGNERIFAVLTLLRYLLGYITASQEWQERLEQLLREYPEIPLKSMGFPENWRDCPIWKPVS